jgi:hypothetical protein
VWISALSARSCFLSNSHTHSQLAVFYGNWIFSPDKSQPAECRTFPYKCACECAIKIYCPKYLSHTRISL